MLSDDIRKCTVNKSATLPYDSYLGGSMIGKHGILIFRVPTFFVKSRIFSTLPMSSWSIPATHHISLTQTIIYFILLLSIIAVRKLAAKTIKLTLVLSFW